MFADRLGTERVSSLGGGYRLGADRADLAVNGLLAGALPQPIDEWFRRSGLSKAGFNELDSNDSVDRARKLDGLVRDTGDSINELGSTLTQRRIV